MKMRGWARGGEGCLRAGFLFWRICGDGDCDEKEKESTDVDGIDRETGIVIYVKWFYFEVKLSEVSNGEVLVDTGAMYIRVNLYRGY